MKRLFTALCATLIVPSLAFAQDSGNSEAPKAEAVKEAPEAPKAEVAKEAPKAEAPKANSAEALLKQGPEVLLAKVDKNHLPFQDEIIKTKMVLNGGVHKDNTFVFETITKGTNRRAVRFEEPKEMKGMGVVIKGRDEVYAKLPDSNKVRRVGTHSKRQSFYGSDWTMDDMSMITLGNDYTPVNAADEGTHIRMELAMKSDANLPYPKLVIKIDKKLLLIDYIEYYDENLKYVKLQQRMDPKVFGGGFTMYSHVRVTNVATKHTTDNYVLDEKINQNIPDDTFSKRWLIRGL